MTHVTTVVWRAVIGHHAYQVSSDGRVRNAKTGHELKPSRSNSGGYPQVHLGKKCPYVHHLVLLAFVGPKPESANGKRAVCRHLDGDPTNNAPFNLAWGTDKENAADRRAHGREWRGGNGGICKPRARATHCSKGHEYTEENTRLYKYGNRVQRRCIACATARYARPLSDRLEVNSKRGRPRFKNCKQGHPFSEENTIYRKDRPGVRICKACKDASRKRPRVET